MATSNDLNISQPGIVAFDGTATFTGRTITAGAGITVSNGNGISGNPTITLTGGGVAVEHLTADSGGQLNPDANNNFNILGSLGISTLGSGSTITIIPKGGSFVWVDVTGATQALSVQTGYITDHANVTYTLPATAALGDQIRIVGKLGITTVAQNANQQILMSSSSSTVGVTGSVVGTNVGDCVWLTCVTAGSSSVWRAETFVGNWTVN